MVSGPPCFLLPTQPQLPTPPTLELAVDILAVGLDVQVQRQRLVGIMRQLGDTQGHTVLPAPTLVWPTESPTAEGQQGEASRWQKAGASDVQRITLIPGRWQDTQTFQGPPSASPIPPPKAFLGTQQPGPPALEAAPLGSERRRFPVPACSLAPQT